VNYSVIKKELFTDARDDRTGLFEAADKGTLFLDEIGIYPALTGKTIKCVAKQASE
jgi:transcriptional regulator with GAF, ATPase, and Fis domain